MDNFILDLQPDWRYCRVKHGEKRPYPDNWQKTPLELWQVDSGNIGLLLGPASNGVCAIDFDGPSAFTWAEAQGITFEDLPLTPTWSSGKPGRCQMAFRVPQSVWDIISTKKIKLDPIPNTTQFEGFEFRWTGAQSVLPPSVHPDTGQPYEWWTDAMEPVADIPESILLVWLGLMVPKSPPSLEPEVKLEDLNEDKVANVNNVLSQLRAKMPVLSYDEWRTVAWGVAKELGRDAGEVIMREYYPEQSPGEYKNLYKSWSAAKSPSMGSVCHIAGINKANNEMRLEISLTGLEGVKLMRRHRRQLMKGLR
jgi:hypothetical protein